MKYTPAPWKMRPNGDMSSAPRGGKAQQVCSISWSGGNNDDRPGNGRLIENAPLLCEALDDIVLLCSQPSIVETIRKNAKLLPKALQIMESAKTVLQQATGRKQLAWPGADPTRPKLE
jgi:hypothetical protein